jgi:hypothetical protein
MNTSGAFEGFSGMQAIAVLTVPSTLNSTGIVCGLARSRQKTVVNIVREQTPHFTDRSVRQDSLGIWTAAESGAGR